MEDRKSLLENKNFDPIDYINKRFGTEDSLKDLDVEIEELDEEVKKLNKDLMEDIEEHALLNQQLEREIAHSNTLAKDIIQDVEVIQQKAATSEQLVYELCKDIKNLDTAKHNLTFTVTALKKFIMMITAVHKLSEHAEHKNYT